MDSPSDPSNSNFVSVVLVDDSSAIRGILRRILESDPQIKIVASVSNGEMAIAAAQSRKPDIMILDIEMPVMDGLSALPGVMKESPGTKVIMCSSLTEKGASVTMKAMALGAVECIVKPSIALDTGPESVFQKNLFTLIKSLKPLRPLRDKAPESSPSSSLSGVQKKDLHPGEAVAFKLRDDSTAYKGKPRIIAIGSSTGGPQALFTVIKNLKGLDMPIVVTQHMPETFTKTLTEHIQMQTGIPSFEALDDMLLEKGKVYVARGGRHMLFEARDTNTVIKLGDGAPENFCKPAVDPMLRSLVNIFGPKILSVILTGMGQDGLIGARMLVEKGGRVIAQDKETSVVWGMPGAVAVNGLCSAVLPLNDIGPWVRRAAT